MSHGSPTSTFPYISHCSHAPHSLTLPSSLASYSFHINVGSDKHCITFTSCKVFGGPCVGQRGLEANTPFGSERAGPDVVTPASHDTSIHGLRVTENRNTHKYLAALISFLQTDIAWGHSSLSTKITVYVISFVLYTGQKNQPLLLSQETGGIWG
jgi:hypothetical protein